MFNRPLPAPARDIALLIGRVVLGVVLFAHGWQKLMINGIAGTYGQFEKMGIPLAIVSASFTSFVEFVGGVLLIVGALTTTVVALDLVVMVGAAGFVHVTHGIFAQDGGWELVGVIVAAELALAATGPGRFSVDHIIATYRSREDAALAKVKAPVHRSATPDSGTFAAAVRNAPSRVAQHSGPPAQGPRYGAASQVIGRVRVLEQPRTGEQAWVTPAQRPPVEPPMTSAIPVTTPPAQASAQQPSSDGHRTAEEARIAEQSGGYRPVAGFQPGATNDPAPMFDPAQTLDPAPVTDPAPMFDPAQRFAAARLLDAAPVTEQFSQVERPAAGRLDAQASRPAEPRPRADAAPDIAPNVAAALTTDEARRAETPRPASELPQRAARSERVRMAATPFQ